MWGANEKFLLALARTTTYLPIGYENKVVSWINNWDGLVRIVAKQTEGGRVYWLTCGGGLLGDNKIT